MNNLEPKVSVIIPTYKRPNTLDRAINSVLAQTYQNVEVIVVDDNNPDTEGRKLTEEKMRTFIDNPRVRYIQHERNKNGSAARNTGARASGADYVAFLDDDDEFLPKKVEAQVNRLESLPEEWALCYSDYYTVKEGTNKIEHKGGLEGDLYLLALMHKISLAAGSNLLVRKSAFDAVGGFDESFVRSQDHELLTKLTRRYKVAYSDEPGLIVHLHDDHKKIDYEVIINRYIESFKGFIDELSDEDRKEFYRNININRFYHFLRDKKDVGTCLKMIAKKEISIKDAVSLIKKKAKGFVGRRVNK